MCRDVETRLNFVNEAQLLLISEESIADLNNRLSSSTSYKISFPILWYSFVYAHLL